MSEERKTPAANPGATHGSTPGATTPGATNDNAASHETPQAPSPEAAAPEAPAPAPAQSAADPIEALKAENADLRERLLRAVAETENLRKRAEREKRDASQYAISRFAHDLLGVGDNMRRALDTVTADARSAADQALTGLLDGVEMTERELTKALDKHGVKRIDPMGEKFDPNFHQAMFEVPDPSVASGTVVQVVQVGYQIGERCLRPAMVGVAKGGPKSAGTGPGQSDASAQAGSEPRGSGVDKTA